MEHESMIKTKKAFTLAESVVVVAVIGVLAAVILPIIVIAVQKSIYASALEDAHFSCEALECSRAADGMSALVFVQKSGRYYVFEYANGVITPAPNNGGAGFPMSFDELTEKYCCLDDEYEELLAFVSDGEMTYDEAFGECFFRLSRQRVSVLGASAELSYIDFKPSVEDALDNVEVYAGVLIGRHDFMTDISLPSIPVPAPEDVLALLSRDRDYFITYVNIPPVSEQGGHISSALQSMQLSYLGDEGDIINLALPNMVFATNTIQKYNKAGFTFAGWSETRGAEEGFDTIMLGRVHKITLYTVWVQG